MDSPIVADFESFVTTRAWCTPKTVFQLRLSPTNPRIPPVKDFMKTLIGGNGIRQLLATPLGCRIDHQRIPTRNFELDYIAHKLPSLHSY